jgi:hypothetical protein
MPYIWTEPAVAVTHQGVTVYHVYKNGYWDQGHYVFQYTTDITEQANPFDIRDLESFRNGDDNSTILKRAIERGESTEPPDEAD